MCYLTTLYQLCIKIDAVTEQNPAMLA